MTIYTSYFANVRNIPEEYDLFCIAQQMPTLHRTCIQIKEAMPDWRLIRNWKSGKITWQEYELVYFMQIQNKLQAIWKQLTPNAVMLCWEIPSVECHRHLLAKYLNEKYNLGIIEWPG